MRTAGAACFALLVAVTGEARNEARADEPAATTPSSSAPWSIELSERLELVPGAVAPVQLTLRGRGRHSVAQSGLLIDLSLPPPSDPSASDAPSARGISVRQRRYQRNDAAEPESSAPSFSIPVRAEAAGTYALEVRVRFWVCTAKSCRPVDERRAVAVEVREPPPPPAPPVVEPPPPAPPGPAKPLPKPGRPGKPAKVAPKSPAKPAPSAASGAGLSAS